MTEHHVHAPGPPWAALLLVAVAAAATGAIVATAMRSRDPGPPPSLSSPAPIAEITALTARLEQLERRLEQMPPAAAASDASRRQPFEDPAFAQLPARVAQLEQRPAIRAVEPPEPPRGEEPPPDPAAIARQTAASQQTILDAAATEQQKLEAWGQLRHRENGWNDAVVGEMVRLGLSSPDPEVRADVWRQADGRSTHAALAPALLQALQADGDAKVREEAAETLENYVGRPDVVQALTHARDFDADQKVREYAARSLARLHRGR